MLPYAAGLFVLSGLLLLVLSRRDAARAARVRSTPTSSIAELGAVDAGDGKAGVVEIIGHVAAAGDDATFETPLGRVNAVYCRLHLDELVSGDWTGRGVAVRAVPFHVDDGSGALARVDPRGAVVRELLRHQVAVAGVPGNVRAFLAEHAVYDAEPVNTTFLRDDAGEPLPTTTLSNGAMQCIEDSLGPGDPVYVLGPMRAFASGDSAYRGAPGPAVELFADGSSKGELLLSTKTERELRVRLGVTRTFGLLCVVVGAVLAAISRL